MRGRILSNITVPVLHGELTEKQRRLMQAHGTPGEFAIACTRAVYSLDITPQEADAAIAKYNREWEEAGRESAPVSV